MKIVYERYKICIEVDDKEYVLEVRAPDAETYNNLIYNKTYEARKKFMFQIVTSPDAENLERFVNEYPGIVDEFLEKTYQVFRNHFRNVGKDIEMQWKQFETHYFDAALTLLEMIDKPKTKENVGLALLFMDGLQCLRHLREAYSAKR